MDPGRYLLKHSVVTSAGKIANGVYWDGKKARLVNIMRCEDGTYIHETVRTNFYTMIDAPDNWMDLVERVTL